MAIHPEVAAVTASHFEAAPSSPTFVKTLNRPGTAFVDIGATRYTTGVRRRFAVTTIGSPAMQTTACTHGALRILLACDQSGEHPLTMPEMASRLGLSEALVVKACHRLMRAGYLAGQRGRGGGYRLARAAAGITLFEIVELFEDENDLFPCRLRADGPCRLAGVCRLRVLCAEAWEAYADTLRGTSIADVAVQPSLATPA